jgi:hypothetical protein
MGFSISQVEFRLIFLRFFGGPAFWMQWLKKSQDFAGE